jgi:hypothetical protein
MRSTLIRPAEAAASLAADVASPPSLSLLLSFGFHNADYIYARKAVFNQIRGSVSLTITS